MQAEILGCLHKFLGAPCNDFLNYSDWLGLFKNSKMLWHHGTVGVTGGGAFDFTVGYEIDARVNKVGDICQGEIEAALNAEFGYTAGFSKWFHFRKASIAALLGVRASAGVRLKTKASFFATSDSCSFSVVMDGSVYLKGEAGLRGSVFYGGRLIRNIGIGAEASGHAHLESRLNCNCETCTLDVKLGRLSYEYRAFLDVFFFSYELSGGSDYEIGSLPITLYNSEFASPLSSGGFR